MKTIFKTAKYIFTGLATSATLLAGKALSLSVHAEEVAEDPDFSVQRGAEAARADIMPTELVGPDGVFTKISNTLLLIIGLVSVVMLIYGGLRYIISGGDNKKVTDAKNTILYAIIGLIIALLAYAIINFVITAITGQTLNLNS